MPPFPRSPVVDELVTFLATKEHKTQHERRISCNEPRVTAASRWGFQPIRGVLNLVLVMYRPLHFSHSLS